MTPYLLPSNQLILIMPFPAAKRVAGITLLTQLQDWSGKINHELDFYKDKLPGIYQTFLSLFALVPRADSNDPIPALNYSSTELSDLLTAIEKENELKERLRKSKESEEIIIPSSGNGESDLIADLVKCFNVSDVILLLNTYSMQTVLEITDRLYWLNQDPEKLKEQTVKVETVKKLKNVFEKIKEGKINIDEQDEVNFRW